MSNLNITERAAEEGKANHKMTKKDIKERVNKGKNGNGEFIDGKVIDGEVINDGDDLSVDEEEMLNKIKNIPIEKLKQIITDQIDLEIRLKHKELTLTEEEIGKCESQMITLRNYFQIPRERSINDEPNDFTIKYYDLLNRSLSINYDSNEFKEMINNLTNLTNERESLSSNGSFNNSNHNSVSSINFNMEDNGINNSNRRGSSIHEGMFNHNGNNGNNSNNNLYSYRTRSTTSSLRPPTPLGKPVTIGCLYRRTDGVVVKLTCPDCKRSNFSSAQGFLNHSRIAHTQEYTSQDAAALICGEILPDNEQDEEGLISIKNLKLKNLNPSKNLNVNEIYFNGLSNSLNTVHQTTAPTSTTTGSNSNAKSIEKSISPFDKNNDLEDSELMKKFIKNGLGKNKQDFEKYLQEFKQHEIFSDDEGSKEDLTKEEIIEIEPEIKVELKEKEKEKEKEKRKRRRSEVEHPPLPKLKLKLRSDDKKKRK